MKIWACFDGDQLEQIRLGLKGGLDVAMYADTKYRWRQMEQIRWGLEAGLYADTKYSGSQMLEIKRGLAKRLDVSVSNKKICPRL